MVLILYQISIPSGGERLVLPEGVSIDDVVIDEGNRIFSGSLGLSDNAEGGSETLAVFDGGIGILLDRSFTETLADSLVTFEEFQANG